MRFANQIWNVYKNNEFAQDAIETLMGGAISAGGQLLFTDMSPEEIAQASIVGGGLALAARPIGARAGQAAGRYIDRVNPELIPQGIKPYIPITREGSAAALQGARKMDRDVAKGMREILEAKRNLYSINPDGTPRGDAETILGYYGRTRADNAAQYGFALASPFIFGGEAEEQPLVEIIA